MSGGSSANNSWTILTPEETVAETLKPLAEETEHHEESLTSVSGSGENHPENGAESAEGRIPADGHLVLEEKTAELSGDRSTEQHTALSDATPVHTFLEVSDSFVPGKDAFSRSEQLPDSYAHITPSPDEPPASLLSTETLGGVEFTQEEERLAEEGMRHPLNGDGLQQEGEESDLSLRTIDVGKQAVYLVDQLVMELFSIWARRLSGQAVVDSPVATEESDERTEKMGEEGEPEVRRRRSLLAALERIGRTEEEEEGEEEFQLPQRDEDSGFSVNKCILGAVILVGLGTIFFSESDYVTRELKDAELPGKQEWLNPEVPPPPVDADSTELLNKLQAQLQAQKEELNVAKGQAAEGAKERLRWEEVEKENSRLKKEMASLPVLQKENERMKRELESVPALQKELETLRSTVTDLKLSSVTSKAVQAPVKPTTSPSSGQPEDSTQDTTGSTDRQARKPWDEQREKKDKNDMGEKKEGKEREKSEWMEREKQERKDGGKAEWKKGKFDKEKDKEGKLKRHSDEPKQRKEKDWKKEKASRGDEGKPWKDREAKKEWIEKGKRKELKEEKYWKKAKHEQVKEDQQWSGKEEKVENNQGEKEWKKGKDGFKESGKEKWEKKDWKEKGEKREWKKDNDWKSKNGKDHSKEGKGKGERKQWEESKHHGKERKGKDEGRHWNENKWKSKDDKEWKRKDESKQWEEKEEHWKRGQKENKHNGNWQKDRSSSQKHKEHKFTSNHGHKEEHLWGDRKPPHTHRRPSLEQPEYWVQQRDRLQHNLKPPQKCNSLETCAQAEGLLPVPFPEFEAVLQTYLAKAEEVGVDEFKREELKKLAAEFFKTGVFVHDQMRFQEFVEDLVDILEDMVEEGGEEEGDSAIEEDMEGFEREVMKKFSVPGAGEKEERSKGEWGKGSERGRG
ncbi:pre-B-cell leukemia homeobox interacting protein 1b isoform X2 [Micropterus dolomieu]|uniref:pre-B-cell leukemia homeobox interacting protein 1b isoform X2 n=1 Tax=Micropterus dolomieu TaxID=147949 RepID=UPI001E8DC2AA|nr:pre-B-cell leukemia homeobox interacting protein 1b isoform X2 [Micropterus dolomieu]